MAFKQHLTFLEALKLNVGDKVDHRNVDGHFGIATIIEKANDRSGLLCIRYDGLSAQYDIQCSYINELHRFAEPSQISRRPAHRLNNIKKGSFVDINTRQHPGWRKAEVVGCSQRSGQIQVQYLLDVSNGITAPIKRKYWVHLDNTSEVESFGTHTLQTDINHLPLSLQTKRAYLNIPNDMKESVVEDIIDKVYGGMSNILSILIENASTNELQKIQQIMQMKHSDAISKDIPTNAGHCNQKKCTLTDLSNDELSHICGYLPREDIKAFKLTSYQNGIVCLMEMTKSNVSVSNINEIINDCNDKYCDELGMITHTNYTYDRYCANMHYLALRKMWRDKYSIPLNKQLLLSQNDIMWRFYDTEKNDKMGKFKIREIPTRKWLLFDKRNTVKFDELTDEPKVMNKFDNRQVMVFLKWFDIYFQEIVPLQFIMGNRENMTVDRLVSYIENEFIATTAQQKEWHGKVVKYFKKMDGIDGRYPKLIAHREHKNKVMRFANPTETVQWWTVCIFQLNTSHPAFSKSKFTTIKEKYSLLF